MRWRQLFRLILCPLLPLTRSFFIWHRWFWWNGRSFHTVVLVSIEMASIRLRLLFLCPWKALVRSLIRLKILIILIVCILILLILFVCLLKSRLFCGSTLPLLLLLGPLPPIQIFPFESKGHQAELLVHRLTSLGDSIVTRRIVSSFASLRFLARWSRWKLYVFLVNFPMDWIASCLLMNPTVFWIAEACANLAAAFFTLVAVLLGGNDFINNKIRVTSFVVKI